LTNIYLIRHAEAEGNIYRRAHGQYDGQIIGRGYVQIEHLKARFENEKIDAVYSSDLLRARVTASAIYEHHGLPLNTTEFLREVNMGVWEDMAWGNIEYDDPEMNRFFSMDPVQWQVDGGENYYRIQRRMTECIMDIARQHDGGTVAVFSHGLAIRLFVCGILGLPSDKIRQVPYFDNTSVTLLRFGNDGFSIVYSGDNSHLSNEISTFAHQNWWRNERKAGYENLRFLPFDERRDSKLPVMNNADTEYSAFLGDELVGALGLGDVEDDSVGWIRYIFVLPELRRRNFGVQLLGQAVSDFRKLGRERLRVILPRDSSDVGFFRKFEFINIGENGSHRVMEKFIRNW